MFFDITKLLYSFLQMGRWDGATLLHWCKWVGQYPVLSMFPFSYPITNEDTRGSQLNPKLPLGPSFWFSSSMGSAYESFFNAMVMRSPIPQTKWVKMMVDVWWWGDGPSCHFFTFTNMLFFFFIPACPTVSAAFFSSPCCQTEESQCKPLQGFQFYFLFFEKNNKVVGFKEKNKVVGIPPGPWVLFFNDFFSLLSTPFVHFGFGVST